MKKYNFVCKGQLIDSFKSSKSPIPIGNTFSLQQNVKGKIKDVIFLVENMMQVDKDTVIVNCLKLKQ